MHLYSASLYVCTQHCTICFKHCSTYCGGKTNKVVWDGDGGGGGVGRTGEVVTDLGEARVETGKGGGERLAGRERREGDTGQRERGRRKGWAIARGGGGGVGEERGGE